jgi:hypothetical protein
MERHSTSFTVSNFQVLHNVLQRTQYLDSNPDERFCSVKAAAPAAADDAVADDDDIFLAVGGTSPMLEL